MNVAASESFDRIRPFCIELMQNSNPQTITVLHKTLLSIREDTIDEMAQYVLFPLRVTLKKSDCNEEMKIKISQCFAHVFKHCTVNDWKVIHEMLTSLCLMITDPVDKTLGASGSEELKIGVIEALTSLVGHTCYPVWQKLYDAENIPLLGHVVTLLLSVIKSNVGGKLRVAACEALSSLCEPEYANLVEECNQIGFRLTVGNCVACFLPGITSNLSKILVKDSSVNHKIKSACLDLLSTVITVTLSDDDIRACEKRELCKPSNQKLAVLIVKRDKKWTSIVTEKLGPIIANAIAASDSDNWSERVCCLNFCSSLLLCCRDTLKSYSNLLLKVPIKLLSDDYQQVIDRSNEILKSFSSILAKNEADATGLVAILEENLFSLCSDLPRLMRKASDEEKLSSLKILLGYLTLLKEKVDSLLYSFVHLKKLAAALLHCFELDTSSIQFLEQVSPSPGENSFETGCLVQHFRKQFCHFRDARIRTVLSSICRQLGQFGDVELLVDHFVEIYASSETNCKQAVMILNELLLGAKNSSRIEPGVLKSIVSSVLDEYIAPENWYLVTTSSSEYFNGHYMSRKNKMEANDRQNSKSLVPHSDDIKPSQTELTSKLLKSNTVLACLHLESLLLSSVVLGEDFRILLMSSLSLLLEKTTDEDISISECATHVLQGVARNCGYESAEQLIAANADYIISDISIQLNHIDLFPRCPSVLTAMLNNSNSDILVIVSDTVDEIVTSFDLHHLNPRKILIFLPVLLSVVRAVKRWTTVGDQITEVNSSTTNSENKNNSFMKTDSTSTVSEIEKIPVGKHTAFVNKLKQDLLDFQNSQRTANMEFEETPECQENDFENPNSNQDDEEHVDVEEEKEKIPLEIQVVSKVLERCIHLMTHSDPRVRMRVMEVVRDGMQVMSMKENQLLPMAHKFWQPLVARFQDRELQVVSKAFDTLCIIASHSKDFLRKRFSKEILPKLLKVLRHQASFSTRTKSSYSSKSSHIHLPGGFESTLDSDSSAYSHTVTYKLQKSVLLSLGPLLKSIDVNKKELDSVCTSLLPYLSSRQDVQLQDAAYSLFEHMISIDRDIVWLSLTSVWCPMSTLAPLQPLNYQTGARLRTIHLAGNTSTDSEYHTNVSKLLKIC